MARVFIDTQFFSEPRHRLLMNELKGLLDGDFFDCIRFRLIAVYHESYLRLSPILTAEQIDIAAGCVGFATALLRSKLADEVPEGLRLRGMVDRVEKLQNKVALARQAGIRSAESRKAKNGSAQPTSKKQQPFDNPRTNVERTLNTRCDPVRDSRSVSFETPNDVDVDVYVDVIKNTDLRSVLQSQPESLQSSSSLVNESLELYRKESTKRSRKEPKEVTSTTKVWQAYCESMLQHWAMKDVPRSAKVMGCAKRLVDLVGEDKAIELARYYPTRRKQYYVQAGHKFELLVSDYMALLREMNAGIKLTNHVVKEIVSREETETFHAFESTKQEKNLLLMDDDEFEQYEQKRLAESKHAQNSLAPGSGDMTTSRPFHTPC